MTNEPLGPASVQLRRLTVFRTPQRYQKVMWPTILGLIFFAFGFILLAIWSPYGSWSPALTLSEQPAREGCQAAKNARELSQRLLHAVHSGYRYQKARMSTLKECANSKELAEEYLLMEVIYGGFPAILKALENVEGLETRRAVLFEVKSVYVELNARIVELSGPRSKGPNGEIELERSELNSVEAKILRTFLQGGVGTTNAAKRVLDQILATPNGHDVTPALYAEGSGYEQFIRRFGAADLSLEIATLIKTEISRQEITSKFPKDADAILHQNYSKQIAFVRQVFSALLNDFHWLETRLEKPGISLPRQGKWVGEVDWENPQKVKAEDGTPLAVWEYPGGKELILIVGGWPSSPGSMDVVAKVFNSMGHRVIHFAQRGVYPFLDAPAPMNHSLSSYIEDIEAIRRWAFRNQQGVGKMHLFGHSWGGTYVQLYAKEHRDQLLSLFMSAPSTGVGTDWKEMYDVFAKTFRPAYGVFNYPIDRLWWNIRYLKHIAKGLIGKRATMEHARYAYPSYYFDPNEAPDVPLNSRRAPPGETLKQLDENIRAADKDILNHASFKDLKNSIPVMITFGERDIYDKTLENRVKDRFGLDSFHVFKKSGHFPWHEDPVGFKEFVQSFYK